MNDDSRRNIEEGRSVNVTCKAGSRSDELEKSDGQWEAGQAKEKHDGFCACGCGGRTSVARSTCKKRNVKKGDYYSYIFGHQMRGKHHSLETRNNYSLARRKEKNPQWKGGFDYKAWKNKPENKRKQQEYRKRTYQKFKEYRKVWSAANPEKIKQQAKRARAKNKGYYKTWAALNPEKVKKYQADYKKRYPEKDRAKQHKRRALKARVQIGDVRLIERWEREWKKKKTVTCYWCKQKFTPIKCHADHAIALAIGGSHSLGNLVISCRSCNVHKHAKTIESWNMNLSQPALSL